MKKFLWPAGLLACVVLVMSCSTDPVEQAQQSQTIQESVNDVLRSDADFDFSTLSSVRVHLSLQKAGGSVSGALITVYGAGAAPLSYAYTDPQGIADFNITAASADQDITLVISHAQYPDYTSSVQDLGAYQMIDRSLTYPVATIQSRAPAPDRDGDGVPDAEDEFPDDSRYAKAIHGQYTLTFEDLYPVKGDADFNDAVTLLDLEERINGQNKLAQVIVTARALASGAGYKNQLYINLLGQEYQLIENYKTDLSNKANSSNTPQDLVYVPSSIQRTQVIDLDPPIDRYYLAPMPYDPFLIPNGFVAQKTDTNGNRYEVHLPFCAQTNYQGKLLDEDGFPWALIVPGDWLWPFETVFITNAYPRFKSWYESYGKMDSDWYLYPEAGQVYPR